MADRASSCEKNSEFTIQEMVPVIGRARQSERTLTESAMQLDSPLQQDAEGEPFSTDRGHTGPLKICLISLHRLIRARDPELGKDPDTGV